MGIKNRVDMVQARRITKSLNQMAMDARVERRSGAGIVKGDVNDKYFKWELKTREKPSTSITVKKEWYDKTEADCYSNMARQQIPGVIFGFGDKDDIVSMRMSFFETILQNHIFTTELAGKITTICDKCTHKECAECPLSQLKV